jgi:sec-independent protein translocase protein TatB
MARHFRSGIDTMMREAELEEMEKKWREDNERIMREHPLLDAGLDPGLNSGAEMMPLAPPAPAAEPAWEPQAAETPVAPDAPAGPATPAPDPNAPELPLGPPAPGSGRALP